MSSIGTSDLAKAFFAAFAASTALMWPGSHQRLSLTPVKASNVPI